MSAAFGSFLMTVENVLACPVRAQAVRWLRWVYDVSTPTTVSEGHTHSQDECADAGQALKLALGPIV